MLEKRDNNINKYIMYFFLVIFIVLIFIFRTFFVTSFLDIKAKYFQKNESLTLAPSEREELVNLRIQNKLLYEENKQIRAEFTVGEFDEKPSPVYLLLAESTLYGDFYVSAPKDKTVYKGMNVFASGNIIVGQVTQILANSLKVERLGQNKDFIATSVDEEESIELKNLGSGLYSGNVSGGSKIMLGDTIILKGFPRAVVGTVVEIAKSDTALSKVYVRTPYNIEVKQMFYVLQ